MQQKGSERFKQVFFSPKVVGTVDGTHLGARNKAIPLWRNYFTRKSRYAVVAMVVNDDKKQIRYLTIGWPAPVHDERVWSNTTIARNPDRIRTIIFLLENIYWLILPFQIIII